MNKNNPSKPVTVQISSQQPVKLNRTFSKQAHHFIQSTPPEEVRSERLATLRSGTVRIPIGSLFLEGELSIPEDARGLVLFVHGSGSSRFSLRNQFVARVLRETGSATLLFDLFTKDEELLDERSGELRFNIEFLAKRLIEVTHWVLSQVPPHSLKLGFFGASTGGAASLVAAAVLEKQIAAVVSRGGRPDLAMKALPYVQSPTLLIVGGNDDVVLELNKQAFKNLRCEKDFVIITDATHLFEEPGTLEQVAKSAAGWFQEHWVHTDITKFRDRREGGVLLADKLTHYAKSSDTIVLGLPRGGVPVAYEVAKKLDLPLDVFVVRKLGLPSHPELAMGAIATGNVRVLNQEVVQYLAIPDTVLDAVTAKEKEELQRRELAYRGHNKAPKIKGKTVILVDDGVATGSSMQAAVRALRQQSPKRIIIAVPTASPCSCHELGKEADEVIALIKPIDFQAVGQYYEEFSQTTDQEVIDLLKMKIESHK